MEYDELIRRIEAIEKQQREDRILIRELTSATKEAAAVAMKTADVVMALGK